MKRRKQRLWPDCDNAPQVDRVARKALEGMKHGQDRKNALRTAIHALKKPFSDKDRQHAHHHLERLLQATAESMVRKMRIWSVKGQRAARLPFTAAFQKAAAAKQICLEKARELYSELYRRAVAIAIGSWGLKAYQRAARRHSPAPPRVAAAPPVLLAA